MKTFGKWIGRILLVIGVLVGGVWAFGPREPVDREISFDPASIGDDLDTWLAAQEATVPNLNPEVAKRIVWAGTPGQKTPQVVVYVHGFSATSEEIRPVPDQIAASLGANLYFARLTGHGRDSAAMAEPTAGDWLEDFAETMEIARRIGDDVIVISTSTGGTITAIANTDPHLSAGIMAQIFVSPNFALNNPAAPILNWPAARYFLPLFFGPEREFEPKNEGHAKYWTTKYPSEAVFPMAAIVAHAATLDYSHVQTPAMFVYSPDDLVVRPDATQMMADGWGGQTEQLQLTMGADDDPYSHVIAGDIISPGQTETAVAAMLNFLSGL